METRLITTEQQEIKVTQEDILAITTCEGYYTFQLRSEPQALMIKINDASIMASNRWFGS